MSYSSALNIDERTFFNTNKSEFHKYTKYSFYLRGNREIFELQDEIKYSENKQKQVA